MNMPVTTWATSVLAAWSSCWLFWCSSAAQHLGMSVCMTYLYSNVLYPGNNVLPRCCSSGEFTSALPVGLFLLPSPAPAGHLPPSGGRYRYRVPATFLIQQSLEPDGWLSSLQTDLIHLFLQWLLWPIMWVSAQQLLSISDSFPQHDRIHW